MITSHLTKRWARERSSDRSDAPTRRRRSRLAAALLVSVTGAGLAAMLTAGTASAAPVPPAAGVAPGSTLVGSTVVIAFTASNRTVFLRNLTTSPYAYIAAGGQTTAAPSVITSGSTVIIFVRGTDNALWVNSCTLSGSCGSWVSLGGTITTKPGAVFQGPSAADYSVYARGANGAAWGRSHTTAGWGAWHSLGGNLLAGAGPAAAHIGSSTYMLVVGIDKQLYLQQVGVTGFAAAGGLTTSSPGLTAISGALVGFARGLDSAAYYHRFLSTSPGWHSMGGGLTTGLSASGAGTTTYTFGLGSDSQVWGITGTWTGYPPVFHGWHLYT